MIRGFRKTGRREVPPIIVLGLILAFGVLAPAPGLAEDAPRTCALRPADDIQAELQAAYRAGQDFSTFAGVKTARDFDEVFTTADALFAAIQKGRCQAVVTDGQTAAALVAAMGRDGIASEVFEVRRRDAVLEALWKSQGYASQEGFLFSRGFTPVLDPGDVKRLAGYGVTTMAAFEAGVRRMNASGYSDRKTTGALFAFLDDERIGAASGKSAVAVQQARAERARAEAAAARRAELAEFPYVAFITCGMNGGHIATPACFGDTELEVRNGSAYGLYKIYSLDQAGVETNRGLMIKLRRSFAIRAQNSDDTLVLGVEVQDAATRQVLFQQQAGQFRTLRVSR